MWTNYGHVLKLDVSLKKLKEADVRDRLKYYMLKRIVSLAACLYDNTIASLALPSAWKNGLADIPYNATTVSTVRNEIKEKRNGTLIGSKNIL